MADQEKESTAADKRLANLKPFPKGVSGNPRGRPPAVVSKSLRRMVAEIETGADGEESRADYLARILYESATGARKVSREQLDAIKIVLDRLEGRPRQTIALETDEEARRERKLQNYIAECERAGDSRTRAEAIADLAEEDEGFLDYE